jgi:hypothetical protein
MARRWNDYFLTNEFSAFWKEMLKDKSKRICVICGVGFDPRCTAALTSLAEHASSNQVAYIALRLRNESSDTSSLKARLEEQAATNIRRLQEIPGVSCLAIKDLPIRDGDGYPCGGRVAVSEVSALLSDLATFDHIAVDISGLPRSAFFPLIKYLIQRADAQKIGNVHVVATDDSRLDRNIQPEEFGDADYLHTFRSPPNSKYVWVPVVGRGEEERVRRIYEHFKSDCEEICPIIPFPGPDLRLADDVIVSTGAVLFDECGVSPENLLLCDAATPFDAYRKVTELHSYYKQNLEPMIGSITTVLSPLASKSLSVGLLLASVELSLPVCYVETGAYRVLDPDTLNVKSFDNSTWSAWLTGDAYATS